MKLQVTLHPEKHVRVMDVTDDAVILLGESFRKIPTLMVAFMDSHAQTSTTTTTTASTTSMSTTTTTTTTTTITTTTTETETTSDSSTTDCDEMEQSIQTNDGGEVKMSTTTTRTTTKMSTTTSTTTTTTTTTTCHPHSYPLPFAFIHFQAFTPENHPYYLVDEFFLEGIIPESAKWTRYSNAGVGDNFSAVLAAPPIADGYLPLVVMIHDGPHCQFHQHYSWSVNTFIKLEMAVLQINYRGSSGYGDQSLESVIGNIGTVRSFYLTLRTLN